MSVKNGVVDLATPDELLKIMAENGMIDIPAMEEMLTMKKRKEYLAMHTYSVYQGKDGKWYTTLPDATKPRGIRTIKRYTQEELEDAIISYWKEQDNNPTVKEIFEAWNDKRLELKKIAPGTHERDAQVFKRFFEDFGKRQIRSLTVDDFVGFLEKQIPKYSLTAKSFAGLKRVTKGILKSARKQRFIPFTADDVFAELDLTDRVFKKTIHEDREEVFDEFETQRMMQHLENNPNLKNLGILLMFVTGVRVGELVAIKKDDFFGNILSIRRMESRVPVSKGKNEYIIKEFPKTQAGVRTIAIPREYEWLIKKLCSGSDEYIFSENGVRMTTNVIRRRLERVCKKLGILPRSPHKIRKTYGSILLDNNIDQRFIIEQMGHTNISLTENHYHRNRRSHDKKIAIISEIPEFKAM